MRLRYWWQGELDRHLVVFPIKVDEIDVTETARGALPSHDIASYWGSLNNNTFINIYSENGASDEFW